MLEAKSDLPDVANLKRHYELFRQLQRDVLEQDVDYGWPTGRRQGKPSLFKSGAEKLTRLFNLTPRFEIIERIEREDYVSYLFRCVLYSNERVVGEGYGSCNSKEKKGWDASPLSFANNILKIAKKRSHVDAVLTTLGASNVFSQDLEDLEEHTNGQSSTSGQQTQSQQAANQPAEAEQAQPPQPAQTDSTTKVTEKQLKMIYSLISQVAKETESHADEIKADIKQHYGIEHLNQLTKKQASEVIDHLQNILSEV